MACNSWQNTVQLGPRPTDFAWPFTLRIVHSSPESGLLTSFFEFPKSTKIVQFGFLNFSILNHGFRTFWPIFYFWAIGSPYRIFNHFSDIRISSIFATLSWSTSKLMVTSTLYRSRKSSRSTTWRSWKIPRSTKIPVAANNLGWRGDFILFQRKITSCFTWMVY